jgi:signal transduction histidine kinase
MSLNFTTPLPHQLACGLALFNHQQELLAANTQANKLLDLAPPNSLAELKDLVRESLSLGKPVHDRHIIPGKNLPPILVNTTLLPLTGNGTPQVLATLEETGRVEQYQEHLGQLNRLASIGTLSASVAHEIKNALVPLRTFFELRKNTPDELTEIASQGLRRVESLVAQMLRYGGPAKPAFVQLHVHEVLESALRLIQFQLICKQVILQRSFNAPSDAARGDAYQLEQAFSNIFINALEAMNAGGQLSIATETLPAGEKLGPRLSVRISDTGGGIAPENLSRLFDTFFTTKPNGTGLGLTITRRIFQEHGGAITVESAPNKGTTFIITLPLYQ